MDKSAFIAATTSPSERHLLIEPEKERQAILPDAVQRVPPSHMPRSFTGSYLRLMMRSNDRTDQLMSHQRRRHNKHMNKRSAIENRATVELFLTDLAAKDGTFV